jgi:hypothetical protein
MGAPRTAGTAGNPTMSAGGGTIGVDGGDPGPAGTSARAQAVNRSTPHQPSRLGHDTPRGGIGIPSKLIGADTAVQRRAAARPGHFRRGHGTDILAERNIAS